MPTYRPLNFAKAPDYMPHVWNFIFKPLSEHNYFVESWTNRTLADCAEFYLFSTHKPASKIYFFAADPTLQAFLRSTKGPLFLFGAYNQVVVCQIRAKGTVTCEANHQDYTGIKERIRTRITEKIDVLRNGITKEEAEHRFSNLEQGSLFCFHPKEYAYSGYRRS